MSTALSPTESHAPQTRRYEASSLEAALAAAAAELGTDARITGAHKVRKGGVLGFFAKEHVEVLAQPSSRVDAAGRVADVIENRLRELEAAESGPSFRAELEAAGVDLAPARPVLPAHDLADQLPAPSPTPAPEPAPEPAPDAGLAARLTAFAGDAPERPLRSPVIETYEMTAEQRRFLDAANALPALPPVAELVPGPIDVPIQFDAIEDAIVVEEVQHASAPSPWKPMTSPVWSIEALLRTGVPGVICSAVAAARPTNHSTWMSALTNAIARWVPPPVRLGASGAACLYGAGAEGAVAMLHAGLQGWAPGTLVVGGRAVPATASVLAAAIVSGIDA